MVGDVLFFRKTNSIVSRIIAKITKSDYTHVGLIVAHDEMTNVATIIESDRFVRTRVSMIKIDESHIVYTTGNNSEELKSRIVNYAYKRLGTEYDYMQIMGIFLSFIFKGERFFNSSNKLICSELIDLAYFEAGVKRKNHLNIGNVTPQELIDIYDLKELEKGA
ncbi:YiiX/YebB-like N1pC/P60 family cysteine hydrolase [Bacillus stercoris]|uniref:YiiX/YebB-like N1pC/P60 family cysteine hydrolase n=1 Tax=Bacillus stercoris TaxID=2054641 RepID=UPI003CFB85A8